MGYDDLISRADAQTELQFAARRYTVAHEAHGEGRVVWSDNLISVTDAMNALRKVPSIQPEPYWIPVTQDTPDEERECWITPKTTNIVYRGVFTRHYGECHRTGFICDDGFMWLNTALAWMYCEVPEPYKGVTE